MPRTFVYQPFARWDDIQFDVAPRFECAQTAPNGTKVATFGYNNPNPRAVAVPSGADNKFSVNPADRRQPTAFLPGTHGQNFSIAYTGSAPSWLLNGATANIDSSRVCSNSLQVTAIQDATLNAKSPNASFGSATTLEVTVDKSSVVKFDRKAILAARGAGRLIKTARVELDLVSGSGKMDAHAMRQDWDEASATWSCDRDQDASDATSRCAMVDRWELGLRPHTHENPYDPNTKAAGLLSASKVVFDVTEQVQRFLSSEAGSVGEMGFMLRSRDGGASVLGSREGNKAARLILEVIPVTDQDLAGQEPFRFSVDASLATTDTLPSLDGQPRPLAVLQPSDGAAIKFAQNELIVATDDAAELSAIKGRWGATEIASPQIGIPGIPKAHVLRIDTARANPSALAASVRDGVNRPDGNQRVSSTAGLGLLAAVAEENGRGSFVGVNWLAPGAALDLKSINAKTVTDGTPVDGTIAMTEPSSNAYRWSHFVMHEVPQAWELLFFTKKLKPTIDVAFVDAGFATDYQDEDHRQILLCPGGQCKNPFDCGGGSSCPWHGVHTSSSGFGEVQQRHPRTRLSFIYYAACRTSDVGGRHVTGTLIFAAAGNANTNVDEKRCFNLLLGDVVPGKRQCGSRARARVSVASAGRTMPTRTAILATPISATRSSTGQAARRSQAPTQTMPAMDRASVSSTARAMRLRSWRAWPR